jgi:hypothetical protein
MHCANPQCHQITQTLREGTLRMVELEVPPDERTVYGDAGFPVCSVPSKYFWLCADCSKVMTIRRWTLVGLILEPFQADTGDGSQLKIMSRMPRESTPMRQALNERFGKPT